jgi:hypothetical protein
MIQDEERLILVIEKVSADARLCSRNPRIPRNSGLTSTSWRFLRIEECVCIYLYQATAMTKRRTSKPHLGTALGCVFITAVLLQSCSRVCGGEGGGHSTSATRDDAPRPVWTSLPVCVFITAGPITKLFAWWWGDIGGHVLRETTSRGLCGPVCPSRTTSCVFITAVPITKLFAGGGGGEWRTCATRDYEPRPV